MSGDLRRWRLAEGSGKFPAAGLRETVLRILADTDCGARRDAKSPLTRTVAGWKMGKGCTPEQWAELVQLVTATDVPNTGTTVPTCGTTTKTA